MINIKKHESYQPVVGYQLLPKLVFFDIPTDYEYNSIELTISIEQEHINIKELSTYLELIYFIDGNLCEFGFNAYSKRPQRQIEFSEIRNGSILLIIEKLLSEIDSEKLIIIYLLLKNLPKVFNVALDSAEKYYSIMDKREDYLAKKDIRKSQKEKVSKELSNESVLRLLNEKEFERLVEFIDNFYMKIGNRKYHPVRFSKRFVKSITLRPKQNNNR
jgi:hypothetical protein